MTVRQQQQTFSDWVYTLLTILILGIPLCGWLAGITVPEPPGTPTPTLPAVDVAACARQPPPYHFPSPDGRFCAVTGPNRYSVIIMAADGRGSQQGWAKWTRFDGWTADSAYALYSRTDQYGNSEGWAFDTEDWEAAPVATGDHTCFSNMSGDCGRGIVAIAPRSPRVLLRDGRIVHLPGQPEANVLQALSQDVVVLAAWSPDETQLAFVAMTRYEGNAVAYLREGDGRVRLLQALPPPDLGQDRLAWGADGAWLQLVGPTQQYDLLP